MEGDWKPSRPNHNVEAEEEKFPLSHKAIPLVLPNSIRLHLQQEKFETSPIEYKPEADLIPEKCNCGDKWKSYPEIFKTAKYYTATFVKSVLVYCLKCVNNKCTRHFDGQSCGILNYSGETLISYTLLNEFFNCCIRNAMSWAGFLNKTNHMYNDVYSIEEDEMQSMSSHTFSKVRAINLMQSNCFCCRLHWLT